MSRQLVQKVLDRFPNTLIVNSEEDLLLMRRRYLPYILEELGPQFGFLIKSNEKIQDDVVCHKNLTHFDCLSADELPNGKWKITAAWKNQGSIQARWKFGLLNNYRGTLVPLTTINEEEPKPTTRTLEEKVDRILSILEKHFK